jgi:hypothetical protein
MIEERTFSDIAGNASARCHREFGAAYSWVLDGRGSTPTRPTAVSLGVVTGMQQFELGLWYVRAERGEGAGSTPAPSPSA